jgi:hypothetical protein
VLPPPLREFRGARSGPLGSIADAVEEVHGEDIEPAYDVFISHATEDKDDLVRPLAEVLARSRSGSLVRRVRASKPASSLKYAFRSPVVWGLCGERRRDRCGGEACVVDVDEVGM